MEHKGIIGVRLVQNVRPVPSLHPPNGRVGKTSPIPVERPAAGWLVHTVTTSGFRRRPTRGRSPSLLATARWQWSSSRASGLRPNALSMRSCRQHFGTTSATQVPKSQSLRQASQCSGAKWGLSLGITSPPGSRKLQRWHARLSNGPLSSSRRCRPMWIESPP